LAAMIAPENGSGLTEDRSQMDGILYIMNLIMTQEMTHVCTSEISEIPISCMIMDVIPATISFVNNSSLDIGIIRGKFIGDYSRKSTRINRSKAEVRPRPFHLLSTDTK